MKLRNLFPRRATQDTIDARIGIALDTVVKGREDKRYTVTPCVYLDMTAKPSCLWGHVLVELGVPTQEIRHCEWASIRDAFERDGVIAALGGEPSKAVRTAALVSQSLQDAGAAGPGETWGKCRDEYYRCLHNER